jgi:hypothetical protein
MQLGQRDVHGRRERGQRGDEVQLALVAAQTQRHGEAQVVGSGASSGDIAL